MGQAVMASLLGGCLMLNTSGNDSNRVETSDTQRIMGPGLIGLGLALAATAVGLFVYYAQSSSTPDYWEATSERR
jgi:hypothetical protein